MVRWLGVLVIASVGLGLPAAAGEEAAGPAGSSPAAVCAEIGAAAARHGLPEKFLVRLIWQESRFDPFAASRVGAQGIAQFMPETARWRGLADPFDPHRSVDESARWLGELRRQFGNLGLAAAAYNAGPKRVQDWLAGKRELPGETRAYVRIITGRPAEEWTHATGQDDQLFVGSTAECPDGQRVVTVTPRPEAIRSPVSRPEATGSLAPEKPVERRETPVAAPGWSLQLVGNRSEASALQEYRGLQKRFPSILGAREPRLVKRQLGGRRPAFWYQVRVAETSRDRATGLCSKLRSAGGQCLVLNN